MDISSPASTMAPRLRRRTGLRFGNMIAAWWQFNYVAMMASPAPDFERAGRRRGSDATTHSRGYPRYAFLIRVCLLPCLYI
jgi:hypothetical protein